MQTYLHVDWNKGWHPIGDIPGEVHPNNKSTKYAIFGTQHSLLTKGKENVTLFQVGNFIKHNQDSLNEVSYDFRTTTQALLSIHHDRKNNEGQEEEEDYLPLFIHRVNVLLQKTTRLLVERENFSRDREFCFRLLHAEDKRRPLSDLIHEKIETLQKEKQKSEDALKKLKFKFLAIEDLMKVKEKELLGVDAEVRELKTKMMLAAERAKTSLPIVESTGNLI